jgi:hypothetical protein
MWYFVSRNELKQYSEARFTNIKSLLFWWISARISTVLINEIRGLILYIPQDEFISSS